MHSFKIEELPLEEIETAANDAFLRNRSILVVTVTDAKRQYVHNEYRDGLSRKYGRPESIDWQLIHIISQRQYEDIRGRQYSAVFVEYGVSQQVREIVETRIR